MDDDQSISEQDLNRSLFGNRAPQQVVVQQPVEKVVYVRDDHDYRHDNGKHKGWYKHHHKHHHHDND